MKSFLAFIFFIFSLSIFAETGIYLSSGKRYETLDVSAAMAEIFSKGEVGHINVFVHGRGKHPEKGFGVMNEVEKTYGVKSIMFHWPSWKSAMERPVGNAVGAAEDLSRFLSALNSYVRMYPNRMLGVKLSLLVHSMGNIVFKEMLENYYHSGEFNRNLFSSLVLNAADVPAKEHKQWVDRIDFSTQNFVTYNDNDIVLFGSEQLDRFNDEYEEYEGTRLGKDLEKVTKGKVRYLSQNAKYLNLSKMTFTGHRHFLVDDKKKNIELKNLFSQIIKGRAPYLNSRDGVYDVKHNTYYFKN
ncbi:alpha/beta hydrolase [Halobacteriovorax sp.]|uniref:alpha/beta hydrolase n=1 Tax=Halobacteriovorax sp. TaxID=2020862 RepID=UPI003567C297